MERAWVSAIGGLVELRQKGLAGLLAGVVGELDRNRLSGTWWLLSIQALDGLFSLYPLIKADEAHTSGATCGASRSETKRVPFTSQSLKASFIFCAYVQCTVCMWSLKRYLLYIWTVQSMTGSYESRLLQALKNLFKRVWIIYKLWFTGDYVLPCKKTSRLNREKLRL